MKKKEKRDERGKEKSPAANGCGPPTNSRNLPNKQFAISDRNENSNNTFLVRQV